MATVQRAHDTASGVRQLKQGIGELEGPSTAPRSAFLRFQLALALSARPERRQEGLDWLWYAFDGPGETYLVPLTYLALGRTWSGIRRSTPTASSCGSGTRPTRRSSAGCGRRVRPSRG